MGERMLGRKLVERVLAVAAVGTLLATAGCGAFFQCEGKASCTTASTTTVSGDFAYITNTGTVNSIAQYNISSGSFVSIGTAISTPVVPGAMKVTPNNALLYLASTPDSAGIYAYTLGSTGALTIANSGNPVASTLVGAMEISADGNFLYTVDSTGTLLTQYTINKTTGVLTYDGAFTLPGQGCLFTDGVTNSIPSTPTCSIAASPNKDYVAVALYTYGIVIFPYTSSAGLTTASYTPLPGNTAYYSVTFDSNDVLYAAETAQVESFKTSTASTISHQPSGSMPRSIVVSGNKYVYTANEGSTTGTVSMFASSSGTLSAKSDTSSVSNVSTLGLDNSGKFLLAVGYNATTGIQLFSIGSSGGLTAVASLASTATLTTPAVVALTH